MVAKFKQSNYNTQTGTEYPLALDASVAVLAELAAQFAVSAQDTPNLTVAMRPGRIYKADRTIVEKAAQNSATLVAPTVNPRNDIVHIDATTGTLGIAQGAEAASPVDPAIPANKLPKARIRWTVGAAQITNSMIDDLRFDAPSLDAIYQWMLGNVVWAISNGGTGATSAAGARAALGLTIGVAAGNIEQVDQALTATTRAATTVLGTSLNHTLSDTSANIAAFNGVAGVTYHCRALGAGELVHHATNLIITQGGTKINTKVGDTWDVEMITATTCRIKNYQSAALSDKAVTATHDISTTGTQDITGVGFFPSGVTLFVNIDGVAAGWACWGVADGGAGGHCMLCLNSGPAFLHIPNYGIALTYDAWGVTSAQATVALNADGAQLTWSKNGSPTGIANIVALFHR